MATAQITYNLEEMDDLLEFKQCIAAPKMASALFELVLNTKKKIVFELDGKDLDKYETLDLVFERINQILDEHNVNVENLNY